MNSSMGTDSIEMHSDALTSDDRVLIIDDLLATGGTAQAAVELVNKVGAEVVAIAFLIELLFLNGRKKLGDNNIRSLMTVESE